MWLGILALRAFFSVVPAAGDTMPVAATFQLREAAMSSYAQPQPQQRTKDHWSLRLRVKRPGTGSRLAVIILGLAQTLIMTVTVSSLATGGGLYGCSNACGTTETPTTPAIAVFFGMLMLVLPLVMGALSESWQAGVAFAMLPWFPAVLLGSNTVLAPVSTVTVTPGARGALPIASSHFGPPFWLDPAHVSTLVFSLALFALLGFLGWVAGQALRGEA
jgi:hypothetical protein